VQPRIFYGHNAAADKVGTGFVETNVGGVSELCSGVLIGTGKFLTAAHCVADSVTKMRVGFGPIEGPAVTVPVLTATAKPAYKLAQSGNDLAVLGIDPAKLCAVYKPYAVAKADNLMLLAPAEMTVVGYGLTERQVHGTRLEANIPVATLTCFQQWATALGCKTFEELILSSVIMPVSGIVKGTDTCYGDSGGPAFVYSGNKIGVGSPMLAAITSQGIALGTASVCGAGGIYEVVGTIENINWLKQLVPDLIVE
jgi:secreted trypsin-like serine protease